MVDITEAIGTDSYSVQVTVTFSHVFQVSFKFFGHMAKLPDDPPANFSLNEFRNTKAKKFRDGGGQKLTWLKQLEREVMSLDFDLEQAIGQAQNREQWQGQIELIMHMN